MANQLVVAGSSHVGSVKVEKVEWPRLLALLSPRCNALDGHEIVFTSAHFSLTGWKDAPLVVGGVNVSLRINWLHDCFSARDMTGAPLSGHVRRAFFCEFDSNVVHRVLQAMPRCSTLTHAAFSFSGYNPVAVERLLFPLCTRLRSTETLSSLYIDIGFPLQKLNGLDGSVSVDVNDDTIRRFSPILLVRNHNLQALRIHSDCHSFDREAAEHLALFVRENSVLKSLDLRLLVISMSTSAMGDALWILMRPLSDAVRFGYPSQEVFNKTLRTLVLKFIIWNLDQYLHLASYKHDVHLQGSKLRGGDVLVPSSFFMCPFLHKLSLTLSTLKVSNGSEVIHVAAQTRCSNGHKELHIQKYDESELVSDEIYDMWVFNLDSVMRTTFRYANADVLVLRNPSPAALKHYIPIYGDSYRGPVRTIKLSSTAKDEDIAFQRARLGAVVSSILKLEAPKLNVEMTHRYWTLLSTGRNSEDMWELLRQLRGSTSLQSFILDKWELRRVDGGLHPLYDGAFLCIKSDKPTKVDLAEYEVRVKMSSRR